MSLPQPLLPALELRTLRISSKVAGFEYEWQECIKPGLFGNCRQWQANIEYYDLSDVVMRNKLTDMGFVALVRKKPIPMNLQPFKGNKNGE